MPTGIPLDSPNRLSYLDSNYYPANKSRDIAINSSGDLVAIGGENNTDPIVIIDISDPSNPVEKFNFSVDWYTRGLEFINDTTLAFGKAIQGLKIVTIGDSSETLVSEFDSDGNNTRDIVSGLNNNLLYLVDDDKGVESIDISDINNPSLAWTYGNADGSNPGFAKAVGHDTAIVGTVQHD